MSLRITQAQLVRGVLSDISANKEAYSKYSNEVSSGLKASDPGDSKFSATISQYQSLLASINGHTTRISAVEAQISFQDEVIKQSSDLLVRASEIATQAGNETVGTEIRAELSEEVMALRDQLVSLANSQYQGRYVYGGTDDSDPPYTAQTYDAPATGAVTQRYTYDDVTANPAAAQVNRVNITDNVSITVNTPGNEIFDRAIQALEMLGRTLAGYRTDTDPATGVPTGTGTAYNLPTDMDEQTEDIQNAMNLLESARKSDVMPERVSLGARLSRIEAAQSMLSLAKTDAKTVLDNLQSADYAESASNLSQASTALEAAYTVSSKILNMSILNYL